MSEENACSEGFDSVEAFLQRFKAINNRKLQQELNQVEVYAVEFQVLERLG